MMRSILRLYAAALVFVPVAASAHPVIATASGFEQGFAHPLSGLDHVLVMVTVGLLAARLGGRALWLLPSTFLCAMAVAGVAGKAGVHVPFVEIGIGMSVIILGLAVASEFSAPVLVATSLVGFFAIFHGHAHGTEMAASLSGLSYGLGFVCATVLLHATGVGLGLAVATTSQVSVRMIQVAGAAMATAGVAMVFSP